MNNYILPGIYIEQGIEEKYIDLNTFATLFLSFEINEKDIELTQKTIYLKSLSDIERYSCLKEEMFLTKAIHVYFENGGTSLYIMPQPSDKEVFFNTEKYRIFLEKRIDVLIDIETILSIDIFFSKIIVLNNKQRQGIQNTISMYCKKSNRLSLMDLPFDTMPMEYAQNLYYSIVFYPWLKDKGEQLQPPSLYAAALLSKLADENKVFHSIANIKLKNAIDTTLILNRDFGEKLYKNSINPILHIQNDGYKIWGIKTLRDEIKDINTLRVLFFIKRALYLIAKEYVFETHTKALEEKIIRKVKNFLFSLWKSSALKGTSEEEAFIITMDESHELSIHIAVSISKPLEFIVIHLNKITDSDLQSTLNIS